MEEKKKQLTKLNEQRSCLLFKKKKSPEADDYLVFTFSIYSTVTIAGRRRINPFDDEQVASFHP